MDAVITAQLATEAEIATLPVVAMQMPWGPVIDGTLLLGQVRDSHDERYCHTSHTQPVDLFQAGQFKTDATFMIGDDSNEGEQSDHAITLHHRVPA